MHDASSWLHLERMAFLVDAGKREGRQSDTSIRSLLIRHLAGVTHRHRAHHVLIVHASLTGLRNHQLGLIAQLSAALELLFLRLVVHHVVHFVIDHIVTEFVFLIILKLGTETWR